MSKEKLTSWAVIEATKVSEHVPTHLSALQILCREPVGPVVRICVVGDIGLSGRVAASAKNAGPIQLDEVASVLRTSDITFGNLETPLAGTLAPGQMFAAPVSGATLLLDAGFNLINLANNHATDFGKEGLAETMSAISEKGMAVLGANQSLKAAKQLLTTRRNGLQIGWLGCGRSLVDQGQGGPYFWEFDESELHNAVNEARSKVDVLIVSMHIGLMYIDYPRPEHKIMAERLMAAGANLILMHHAHILQGVQVTSQGHVCCYNLGNFLFDSKEGDVQLPIMLREQNEGAVFLFTLDKSGIAQVAALPTWMDDDCRVHWAIGERGKQIIRRLARISQDLEGDFVPVFKRQRAERNTHHIIKVLFFEIRHGNWAFVVESLQKIRFEHVAMTISWLRGAIKQLKKGTKP